MAQEIFKNDIICNEFYCSDSILFFREIKPGDCSAYEKEDSASLQSLFINKSSSVSADLLSALCYYPELAHVRIWVSCKSIKKTMNSRPTPLNIFRKRSNRVYHIIVNSNEGKNKGLSYSELSFNIKTGWFGHELAHICAYEKMSTLQTILFAIKYIGSKKYIRMVERNTDLATIEHGLAYPLYDGTEYLLRNKFISEKYKEYSVINGLSPNEIKCFWCKARNSK
ncbi:MAG: hypothetical protein WCI92_16180 [Bacteroidota bacterium]